MAALIAAPLRSPQGCLLTLNEQFLMRLLPETAATFDKRWCLKLLGQNQRLFLGFYVDLVRHLLNRRLRWFYCNNFNVWKNPFQFIPPVTVPPVPTPETNASKPRLPKTSTISFPVFVHVPLISWIIKLQRHEVSVFFC